MRSQPPVSRLELQESANFILTNRIPRLFSSWFMGKISKIKYPWFAQPALWVWRKCADLSLHEAQKQQFNSIHDCFTRALKPGARPVAENALGTSPCDGILGAHGLVENGCLLQVKGFPYAIEELLVDPDLAMKYHGHRYVTIRITASMYHRMHSPLDGVVDQVDYIHGDTWNVNPVALKRVEKLFCKNERAVLSGKTVQGESFAIVPVAAILVAGIRLHCTGRVFDQNDRGPQRVRTHTPIKKGEELGWFEHGSTIVLLVPPSWKIVPDLEEGSRLLMGQALFE
ncbi:archaetidylserine decarboxylase [Limnobacter parvus]|uniref:phosphatidylserine decarboxylase n=1 Tax=Limnobacter parvus TaxID=2939690 RepID=A0ABT1XK49_9BURK|nr:archaetidylserine decarboxylase [Limnobacter parvus]